MSHLVPCPSCHRHVRTEEASCPFCQASLEATASMPPELPKSRLGRAATFAFGASLVGATALVACGAETTSSRDGGEPGTGGTTATTGAGGSAGRSGAGGTGGTGGIIILDNTGGAAGSDSRFEGGTVTPVYGAPAAEDAGTPGTIYGAAPSQ